MIATLTFENVARPLAWLGLVALVATVLAATYRGIGARTGNRLAWALMLLRAFGLAALILALAKPTWTSEHEFVDPPRLGVIVDDSASMSLPDPSGPARLDLATKALAGLRRELAKSSGPTVAIDLFDLRGNPLESGVPTKAEAGRTDLVRPLVASAAKLRARPLAGLVLISDGMDNSGRKDFAALADLGVPVHTLGFRPPDGAGAMNLAIRRVQAPERAMIHNAVKVDVLLSKTGGPATRARVSIRRGRDSVVTDTFDLPAGDVERPVALTMTPDQTGRFVFTTAVSSPAGEPNLADNVATFPLRVDKEPIRVLYLEGFLRFEYKYLKARLEDDPDVSLVAVVRRANPERVAGNEGADLVTPDRLKAIDILILGDMEASFLGASEYQAILAWLDEKNHALLVLGGEHAFGSDGVQKTPLARSLPVVFRDTGVTQTEEPFTLERTDAGRRHPIFELSGDRVRDDATWGSAPPLSGSSLVARAKPGADVLAVNPNVKIDGTPAVVVAVQRYGGGHTMVLLADTTWRWSRLTRVLGQDDTLFARFWSQTLRWLAGRSRDETRAPLVVSTDRPDYTIGQTVSIRVLRQPGPGTPLARAEFAAEVTGPTGAPISVPLKAGSAEPDVFLGTFVPSSSGRYEVAVTATAAGVSVANGAAEVLVQGADLERSDPGTNRDTLRAISSATGGESLLVDEAEKLASKIDRTERRIVTSRRVELWHSPILFLAFLSAVSAEWLLRRRHHLV